MKQRRRKLVYSARETHHGLEELESRVLLSRPLGVDVSNNNGTISWSTIKNAGISFAWAKASEGSSFTDTYFAGNMTNAAAQGIYIGAYHFARYDANPGTAGADSEEAFFWSKIKNYYTTANAGKYLMPMLDVEQATSETKAQVSAWVNEFCNKLVANAAAQGVKLIPIVYTYTSYASSYIDSTVPASWPLNMASYNGQGAQTGAPSTTSPWQSGAWSFWQYSSSTQYGGKTIDSDVFNGDAGDLQAYVAGSTTWAAGARVATNTSTPDYDSVKGTHSLGTIPVGTTGTITGSYGYGSSYMLYQVTWDSAHFGSTTGWVQQLAFDSGAAGQATSPNPADTTTDWIKTLPSPFTWGAGSNATSYKVYLDGALEATVTGTSWTHPNIGNGTHVWRVDSLNGTTTTLGTPWTFNYDNVFPTANYGGQTPNAGDTTFNFTVTYNDSTSGVDVSTLDDGDIKVTGPNGYSANATFVSVDDPTNGSPRVATYSVPAPGGIWNANDNGTYSVIQNGSQVTDVAGNARPAAGLKSFSVALPVAYVSSGNLVIDSTSSGATISINSSGSNIMVTEGASTLSFDPGTFSTITINGSTGNDTYNFNAPLTQPVTINGSGGNDQLNVSGGTLTIASDLSAGGTTMAAYVTNGGYLVFNSTQHLAGGLNIGPTATAELVSGHNKLLVVPGLAIDSTGRLQLQDNAMIVDYVAGSSPVVAIQQYLASGFNGGSWNGNGIKSGAAAGDTNHRTALGYAENSDLGLSSFDGESVDGSAIIIKYTYYGDNDLDGQVTSNDLSRYVSGRKGLGSGWVYGDYDYSGKIDLNDFSLFVDTFNLQGAAL